MQENIGDIILGHESDKYRIARIGTKGYLELERERVLLINHSGMAAQRPALRPQRLLCDLLCVLCACSAHSAVKKTTVVPQIRCVVVPPWLLFRL
jgi:hypothetical protein